MPGWGSGQGWHHEPSPPQPCNDPTGGENCSLGGTWGTTGMSWGQGGVTVHTMGMWGKEGPSLEELSPIPGCSTTGVLVGWAAWMLLHTFWGIPRDLPSLTAERTLSHLNKDPLLVAVPCPKLLDKYLGTASPAAAAQGQLMWALGTKNHRPSTPPTPAGLSGEKTLVLVVKSPLKGWGAGWGSREAALCGTPDPWQLPVPVLG